MELFKPPTDNLYKFMAVLGLLLAVISAFYSSNRLYELKLALVELKNDAAVLQDEQGRINEGSIENTNQISTPTSKNREESKGDSKPRYSLDAKVEKLQISANFFLLFNILAGVGLGGGLLLSYKGFLLWYWRVQVYQDAIIKKQAEEIVPNIVENAKKRKPILKAPKPL